MEVLSSNNELAEEIGAVMSSILKKRTTRIWAASAVLVAAALDLGSTLLGFQRMGGSHGEANPLFRAFSGHESSGDTSVVLLLSIKGISSCLAILWIWLGMRRIPNFYPQTDGQFGFFRFANNVFYGKDVPWWTAIFGIPPFKRCVCFYSLPMAMAIVVASVAASVTNTLGLITSYSGAILFVVTSGMVGLFLGLHFIHRDFLILAARSDSQQANGG
jgi:hypothetical protein